MKNKSEILDYILVYLLVALSGIPFFYKSGLAFLIPTAFLSFIVFVYRRKQFDGHSMFFFSAMFIVLVGQMIKFDFFPVNVYLGIFLRMSIAFFIIKSVGNRFIEIFINIIVASAIISYFFYFPSYIPGVENLLKSIASYFDTPFRDPYALYVYWPNVIVYNINTGGAAPLLRNSGPFWEPGAFGGYLIIALSFNIIINKTFLNKKGKYLLFAILTTFSTTAYVSLLALILFSILVNAELIYKIVLVPLIIAGSIFAFTSLDFLGEKIASKANIQGNTYNTRFTSAVLDINDTYENPWLGLGRSPITRYKGSIYPHANHRNNGTTGLLINYGVPFFILYLFFIFLGYKELCKQNGVGQFFAFYIVLLIVMIGFSEMYFNYPFFFGLALLYPVIKERAENEKETPIIKTT